jgi:hypothetical protein
MSSRSPSRSRRINFTNTYGIGARSKRRNRFVKSSVKDIFKLNTKYPLLVNPKLYPSIQLISNPQDSASGAAVYLLHNHKREGFILKLNFIFNKRDFNDLGSFPATEDKIYKLMNELVKKRITPHVITRMDSLRIKTNDLDDKTIIPPMKNSVYGIYAMLNETSSHNVKLTTLYDFFKKLQNIGSLTNEVKYEIILNILFQILYTLEAFNKIGLKHNDLHMGNILVFEEPRSNKYIQYILSNGRKVNLEHIGFTTRIFDFDRSCKKKISKSRDFNYAIEPSNKQIYAGIGQTCIPNAKFDTYKLLYSLVNLLEPIIGDLFYEFFHEDSYLLEDGKIRTGEIYNKPIRKIRYGFLKQEPDDEEMLPTSEILEILADIIPDKKYVGHPFRKYSLRFIK